MTLSVGAAISWWRGTRRTRFSNGSPVRPMVEMILMDHLVEMDQRRTVILAIADLSPDQRAQLLLYLLGDDWAATDVIDARRWIYQEYVPWPRAAGLPKVESPPKPVARGGCIDHHRLPEGEDL